MKTYQAELVSGWEGSIFLSSIINEVVKLSDKNIKFREIFSGRSI